MLALIVGNTAGIDATVPDGRLEGWTDPIESGGCTS